MESGVAGKSQKRARLTAWNLKIYEKMRKGRKNASARSFQATGPDLSSSHSDAPSKYSFTTNASIKTVSSSDSRFPNLLSRNGILEQPNSKRPSNYKEICNQLDKARETASPTESEFEATAYKIQTAENEQTVLLESSALLKRYPRGYRRVFDQPFNDFPRDAGFNDGLSPAQPDMLEGLDIATFSPIIVRQELHSAAVPSLGANAITLPHLAGEWKGPGKDLSVARHQAAYDGASMVHARNEACTYLRTPDPADQASVHTFTTDGAILNTYAHFSTNESGQIKHQPYPTSSSFLTSSYSDFRRSRRRLRNLQDCAWKNSHKLRDDLLKEWSRRQNGSEDEEGEREQKEHYSNFSNLRDASSAPASYSKYDFTAEEDPSDQILAEFQASLHEGSFCANESVQQKSDPKASKYRKEDSVSDTTNIKENRKGDFSVSTSNAIITPPLSLKDALIPASFK